MTPQAGDHFAHPIGDPDLLRYGTPDYGIAAGRHLGIPFRMRDAEDRAQEARRGAQKIRHMAWMKSRRWYLPQSPAERMMGIHPYIDRP